MPGSRNLTSDVDINLAGMFASIWRKKWYLLLLTLLAGALFFAVFSSISPRYKSESQILIEKRESVFTRVGNENLSGAPSFDAETVGSQVQILNSQDLALAVIKETNLVDAAEFQTAESGVVTLVSEIIGIFRAPDKGPSLTDEERLLKAFRERLTVYAANGSRVLVIEFWAKDRALAKKVVNAMAANYLEFNKNAQVSSTRDATQWLEPEIEDLRAKVLAAEAKVAEFRSSSDILIGQNNALLATQQLSEFSSELSRVRATRSSAQAKVESIRATLTKGGSLDVIPEVIASPFIQRLRERQLTLQSDITQLSTTLLPNHPRIKALRSQLAGFDEQIRNAAQDILKSLENNVDQTRKQEAVLIQEVNRLKSESARVGEAEVKLRALEREAASQRDLLETYLSRYREAASRQSRDYNPVDARIISNGTEAMEAYFPKVLPFTIAGMTSVLLLGMVGLFTAELLSGRAFRPTVPAPQHRDEPKRPVELADTPQLAPADDEMPIKDYVRLNGPDNAAKEKPEIDAEIFGIGLTVQAVAALGNASIVVISPAGDPGSAATWYISRQLSKRGHSTVVVDLTGTGVTTQHMLATRHVEGLEEALTGKTTLRDVLYQDNQSNVHVLAPGNLVNGKLSSNLGRLDQVVDALQQSYEFVLFDCGLIGVEGVAKIADRESLILISAYGADPQACVRLERNLQDSGYLDAIILKDERIEDQAFAVSAA